jgi:aspartate dehydrogenase
MTTHTSVGIIGYGAIGRDLAGRLLRAGHTVTVLLRPGSASHSAVGEGMGVVDSLAGLMAVRPALVVEAAGQNALETLAPELLAAGVTVVAASTGALGDPSLFERLEAAARRGGSRLVVPAGALGGLDYLAALRGTAGASVRYTSRKPPGAWRTELAAAGHNPAAISGEIVLFEGTAAEAARLYPRNLNAGLTVALAAGPAPVVVRVVVDPAVSLNTHEIEAESDLGMASMRFANRPSATNPKTSALTAASLAAAVRRLVEPVVL